MTLPAALFLLSSSRLRRNFPYLNDNGRKSKFKPLSSEGQIEFQKRDGSIRRQTFELLNARSAAQFERLEQHMIGMTLRAGHYDVYVDLDVYDEVEEINKDNNTAFMTFYVKPRNKSESDTEEE